jgi:anti-sigma B factor antagonist
MNTKNVGMLTLPPGRLVASNAAKLLDVSDWTEYQGKTVLVDLSSTDFVDSAGIGALVSFLRQANEKGAKVALCGLKGPVREVFLRCRLHTVFEIFANAEQALKALS